MNRLETYQQGSTVEPGMEGHRPKRPMALWVIGVVVALLVIVGMVIADNQRPGTPTFNGANRNIRALGNENTPVIMTEFADFGCIPCNVWHH